LVLFSPPRFCKAAMLEESVGNHRHERMVVTTLPEWSLEVIETQFFFQLLMRL